MLGLRSGSFARFAGLGLAALLIASLSGVAAPVMAADVPFWEQRDIDDAKLASVTRRKFYKAVAKKRSKTTYAAKPSKKLGGYAAATEPVKKKHKGVKVAALGNTYFPEVKQKKSLSGGGVSWVASAGCLDGSLKAVIHQVAANYGPVRVNSTCRNKGHNRSVGGAPKSKHLSGDAADFRVFGNVRAVYAYLKSSGSVGGLKHYGGGLFHIDNGERRSW